jgi:uncharacterized protein
MIRRLLLHRPLPLASFATGPRPHLPHHEERGRPSTSLKLGARRGFSTRDFLKKIDDMLEDDKGARGAKAKKKKGETQETAPNPAVLQDVTTDLNFVRNKSILAGYTDTGFVVNGVDYEGSLLCLPRSAYLWGPKTFPEITPDSLALVPSIFPNIEILLVGSGERTRRPNDRLIAHFREKGIVVEQMTTLGAIGTFNILNTEDRRVAAAMLHPRCDWDDQDD